MKTETTAAGNKITRDFTPNGSRYPYDSKLSAAKGWAQVDTEQDAWYLGNWASPSRLMLVSYCEGDVTITECPNAEAFAAELRHIASFYGEEFRGIDAMCVDSLSDAFKAHGLGDLLH